MIFEWGQPALAADLPESAVRAVVRQPAVMQSSGRQGALVPSFWGLPAEAGDYSAF